MGFEVVLRISHQVTTNVWGEPSKPKSVLFLGRVVAASYKNAEAPSEQMTHYGNIREGNIEQLDRQG